MKFKELIICFAICLFINCGMKEDTEFQRMGLSFTIPKGWYLIEEDATSDESYLVWIGDKHKVSDAHFQATWFAFEKDIDELIEIAKESYKETPFALVTKIDYSETERIVFKGNEAVMVNQSMKLWNVRHIGEIICFNWDGYSFVLVFNADEKKFDQFEPTFKKIKDSLKRIHGDDEDGDWNVDSTRIQTLIDAYSDFEGEPLRFYLKAQSKHEQAKEIRKKERKDASLLMQGEGNLYRLILREYPDCAIASYVWLVLGLHCWDQLAFGGDFVYMQSVDAAFEARDAFEKAAQAKDTELFPEYGRNYYPGMPIAPIAQMYLAWLYDQHFRSYEYFEDSDKKAIKEYEKLINHFPESVDQEGLLLQVNAYMSILRRYASMNDTSKVLEISKSLLKKFDNQKYEIYANFFGEIHPQAYIYLLKFEPSRTKGIEFGEKVMKEFPEALTGKSNSCDVVSYGYKALREIQWRYDSWESRLRKLQEIVGSNHQESLRLLAQHRIASIYESNLKDYPQALIEYRKLLSEFPNAQNTELLKDVKGKINRLEKKENSDE